MIPEPLCTDADRIGPAPDIRQWCRRQLENNDGKPMKVTALIGMVGFAGLVLALAPPLLAADPNLMVEYLVQKRVQNLTQENPAADPLSGIKATFEDPNPNPASVSPPEPVPPRSLAAAPVHPLAENKARRHPYSVQIKSARSRDSANFIATKLRNQGAPAFTGHIEIPGKGVWHRVFIGAYTTFESANTAAAALKKGRFPDAFVVKTPYAIAVGPFSSDLERTSARLNLLMKDFLAYSPPDARDIAGERLLLGAFRNRDEARLLSDLLKKEGYRPKLVLR
jgi:cell division septation protein DedD